MANSPAAFKQIDVTRAVKGAVAAGLKVSGCRIDPRSGAILVFTAEANTLPGANEWDEVIK